MTKDLEIIEHQSIRLVIENSENLRKIKSSSDISVADAFLLGVIVGKREERKKKKLRH